MSYRAGRYLSRYEQNLYSYVRFYPRFLWCSIFFIYMILNYTTKIEPEQTIGEIQKILSKYGVIGMLTEYDGRQVSSVSFQLLIEGKKFGYKLPCNWRAVNKIFKQSNENRVKKNGRLPSLFDTGGEQAIRTAWRVIKDWVEAQLALVEINMTTIPQVFLPYTIMRDGKTLGEHVEANPGFLLGDGK